MPRPWTFQLPTSLEFGRGTLRRLGSVAATHGSTALLVGYREPAGLEPVYRRAVESLERSGLTVARLAVADPEPSVRSLVAAARQAAEARPEVVVGVGGGSVLDLAKAIAACVLPGAALAETLAAGGSLPSVVEALPVVAVPTTAGTGSEVTSVAVFASDGDPPEKTSLHGPAIAPRAAVVDPDLTLGSPPGLTAACGADALGHAIEAFVSRQANPLTSLLAGRAVSLVVEHLARAVRDPDDPEPREHLALAATLAGAAFNEAGVTVGHAIAHALGAVLGVPHAAAVAVGIPRNLRYNAESCVDRYAALADACRLPGNSPEEKAATFVETVVDLLGAVGLPDRVTASPDAPSDLLDRLVQSATESTRIGLTLNPRKVDAASLRDLFSECLLT